MNWNRLLFIQFQTLPLSMHHKWKEMFSIVYENNKWKIRGDQLSMKGPIELKNSINHPNTLSYRILQVGSKNEIVNPISM